MNLAEWLVWNLVQEKAQQLVFHYVQTVLQRYLCNQIWIDYAGNKFHIISREICRIMLYS